MPKCDLVIEFDRSDRTYRTGETVRGKVTVTVNSDVHCRKLVLTAFSRTHGRGNRHVGQYVSQVLTSDDWFAGKTYVFWFEFVPPHYPLTYRGEYLNVDHYVKVQADIPWAFDPKQEEEFFLVPGTPCHYDRHLPSIQDAVQSAHKQLRGGVIFGVIVTAIGLGLAVLTSGFSLLFAAIGLAVLFQSLRNKLAARKLGDIAVHGCDEPVNPGDTLDIEIFFTPQASGTINEVRVEVIGKEVCVSGSGSSRKTHQYVFWHDKQLLERDLTFRAGMPLHLTRELKLPDLASWTVALGDNTIHWAAVVRFELPMHPDWIQEHPLQVIPHEVASKPPKRF